MSQQMALELYHAIFQRVDNTDDLLSSALCCSAFRDEAQRCLFRHVEPKIETSAYTAYISNQCFTTATRAPDSYFPPQGEDYIGRGGPRGAALDINGTAFNV